MIEKILRALRGAAASAPNDEQRPRTRTFYRWRCSCGAHSREADGGWGIPLDAEYAAQRHMWREGVGHPMPEVYTVTKEWPA